MRIVRKIFEMLGIEPNEEFKIKDNTAGYMYKIDENLLITYYDIDEKKWKESHFDIVSFLTEKLDIIKIPKPTKEEQIAIDYAKACGYKWIAKDSGGMLYAYIEKPRKYELFWSEKDDPDHIEILIPISFIRWEDEEPYYIGD